jgi:hypothetical protein
VKSALQNRSSQLLIAILFFFRLTFFGAPLQKLHAITLRDFVMHLPAGDQFSLYEASVTAHDGNRIIGKTIIERLDISSADPEATARYLGVSSAEKVFLRTTLCLNLHDPYGS